jgi:hypothetical protein
MMAETGSGVASAAPNFDPATLEAPPRHSTCLSYLRSIAALIAL